MRLIIATLLAIASAPANADSLKSMQTAQELGGILASEELCNLTLDQPAIERWIEQNVPASDMGFTGMLLTMQMGIELQIKEQSASARTAHCAQTRRAAKKAGLIK